MITILVIDADPLVRLRAKHVLDAAGFTVIAVADAGSALNLLASLKADLVICELALPGPESASDIATIAEVDPGLRVLRLFPKDRDAGGILGSTPSALGKPFTASELLGKVRRALIG
jgi:DNA-binding NarL/FixJ family response regulator